MRDTLPFCSGVGIQFDGCRSDNGYMKSKKSVHTGIRTLGASAVAGIGGAGELDPAVRTGIEKDEWGLRSAAAVMERAVELARLVGKRS